MRELVWIPILLSAVVIGGRAFAENHHTTNPDQPVLATETLKAVLSWRMEPRFEAGWLAYSPDTHTYDPRYVRPQFVAVDLDACGSRGGDADIQEISIEITRANDGSRAFATTMPAGECISRAQLPFGEYEATTQVINLSGESDALKVPINVRDLLIVSLGDSLSSGEGNPDRPAVLKPLNFDGTSIPAGSSCEDLDDGSIVGFDELELLLDDDLSLPVDSPAGWVDRRCHRSKTSAPALAASAIEDDDEHSSVTFLSLACSGASLRSGLLDPYEGQERVSPADEPVADIASQIEELQTLAGDRRVDALIMSTSINDINFSTIVEKAASAGFDDWRTEGDRIFSNGMANVRPGYVELARRLKRNLDIGEVYIIGYPHTIMRDSEDRKGGCGLLGNPINGISGREVDLLETYGQEVYFAAREATRNYDWNFFETRDLFHKRGYCSSDSRRYMVRYKDSCLMMGKKDGMLHPNRRGHEAIAERITEGLVFGPTPKPFRKLIVTIEAVHVKDTSDPQSRAEMTVSIAGGPGDIREVRVKANTLTPIPATIGTFTKSLWQAPTLPRFATSGSVIVFGTLAGQTSLIAGPPIDPLMDPLPGRYFGHRLDFLPEANFGETDGLAVDEYRFAQGVLEIHYRASVSVIPEVSSAEPVAPGVLTNPLGPQ